MAYSFIGGKFREIDSVTGLPLSGGLLYTYAAGGLTPLATFTDAGGGSANTNPVVLDSAGRADVFLGTSAYRMILKTALGVTVWDEDNITAGVGSTQLAASGGSSLVGFLQTGTGAVASTVQAKLREVSFSIKDFGAKCDGSTDDTAAWNLCVAAATALVTGRFLAGATILVPRGMTFVTSTITITSSNITIKGESSSASVVYAPSSNFDVFFFDGSAQALYNIGVRDLRIYTPGNATAGAHIRATRCINSDFLNNHFIAHYDALVLDGCAKILDQGNLRSQENRTSATAGRYGLALLGTNFSCSDISVMGMNIIYAPGATDTNITFRIEAIDGLYVGPGHQFGKLSFAPAVNAAFPTGQVVASVKFCGYYFDASLVENIEFIGTSLSYRNIDFIGCNARTSGTGGVAANGVGLRVNASSPINRVAWVGGDFDGHPLWAVNIGSTVVDFSITGGTRFNNNNTTNSAAGGDLILSGQCTVGDARFATGGPLGTAISLTASATNCIVHDCDLANSTAANKIVNSGSNNHIHANPGFVTKAFGSATITNPATTIVVNHGLGVTPNVNQISLTFNDAAAGVTRIWPSTATATQFTINANVTPTTTALVGYSIDTES